MERRENGHAGIWELAPLPYQEQSHCSAREHERRKPDERPLERMEGGNGDRRLRVVEIPAQVGAVSRIAKRHAKISTTAAQAAARTPRITLRRASLCRASWRLTTSSFAPRASSPSAFGAGADSPSNSLTGVSVASERAISRSASGTESPRLPLGDGLAHHVQLHGELLLREPSDPQGKRGRRQREPSRDRQDAARTTPPRRRASAPPRARARQALPEPLSDARARQAGWRGVPPSFRRQPQARTRCPP